MQALENSTGSIAYDNFVDSIKTRATLMTYLFCLNAYLAYRKTTNLDTLAKADLEKPRLAEANIKEYIMHLKQGRVSGGYIANNLHAIKHFYNMNDVILNW